MDLMSNLLTICTKKQDIFMSIDKKNLVSFPKNLFILFIHCILPVFTTKKYFVFSLKKFFFILFFIFQFEAKANSSSEDRIKTCVPHVKRNLQQNLDILLNEEVLKFSLNDGQIIKLSSEFLDSSSRFQHYPNIFFGQIKFCPTMESFDLVLSHLSKIGFNPMEMYRYLKKRLYQTEISELPVLKYQIGESWDRKDLKSLLEQNENPNPVLKNIRNSYALAEHYVLLNGEEQSMGWVGSVYFGFFRGYGVFSLPYHGLVQERSGEILNCNNFKFSSPAIKRKKIPGFKQILSLPTEDIVFCLVDLGDTKHHLVASKINWDQNFREQVELITLGIGFHNFVKINQDQNFREQRDSFIKTSITVDFSHECRSLVSLDESRYYKEDKIYPGIYHLAMGCDVSDGNSGDGVF